MAKAKKLRSSEEDGAGARGVSLKSFAGSRELFLVAALFVLAALSILIAPYWGSMKMNMDAFTSLYLTEYDKAAYPDTNFCFSYALDIQRQPVLRNNLAVFANDGVLYFEKLLFEGQNPVSYIKSYRLCFPSEKLAYGENIVSIGLGTEKVFFNIEKKYEVQKAAEYRLELIDANAEMVSFSLDLSNFDRFEPASITVNGKLDHKVYPVGGMNVFSEKLALSPGASTVAVSFRDQSVSKEVYFAPQERMNPVVGLLLFAAAFAVFIFFVFSKESFVKKAALAFSCVLALLVIIGFALDQLRLLSLWSFVGAYVVVIAALAAIYRKNFSVSASFLEDYKILFNPLIILIFLGAIVLPLAFNVFTVTNFSYWNTYYERQSANLADSFSLPLQDDISFFGRPLAFVPGYFFLDAGLSWLLGIDGTVLFSFILLISNIFFLFALWGLGRALGFSRNQSALLYIFLWTENFIRGALFVSPRHALSLALFMVAMALLISNRRKVLSGITLAVCGFVQTPLLFAFPFLYIIIAKKVEWKTLAKVLVIAAIGYGILFLPNFLNFGMVSQAEKSSWGYLITYDAQNIFYDLGALFVFFVLFMVPDIIRRSFSWDSYKIKLFVFALIGMAFQMLVSYRWNIFNAINIVIFLVVALPEKLIENKHFLRLFAILILVVAWLMSYGINLSTMTNYQMTAMDYLRYNGGSGDRILNDPLFGHSIAYFTGRPIMADLAVEYAPQNQLDDVYDFLENKNYSVLKDYNIGWVVNQSFVVNTQAFGSKIQPDFIEFKKIDKVFTNSFFYVHWVGSNKLE